MAKSDVRLIDEPMWVTRRTNSLTPRPPKVSTYRTARSENRTAPVQVLQVNIFSFNKVGQSREADAPHSLVVAFGAASR